MTIKLYNTLAKKKETFKPLKDKKVLMYSCGPTVYDYAHIGNFRAYVFQDILRRYLEYSGYKVRQVMNLTDVDDKTIRGAHAYKIPLNEYTKKYVDDFFVDLQALNIKKADEYPRATGHIKEMVGLIKKLMQKGIAYKGEDGSIYYNARKFRNYGKLSGLKLKELKAGARIKQDQYAKEDAQDFALWKAWDLQDGNIFWETELGKGRPGWHIECSAMSLKHLGKTFDIHTGGVDLIFPHHENEIAQSEAATGKKFVKYWLHCEHLLVNNQKMSKSLGNFYTLRDLLDKGYDSKAIRYILLAAHYRQKLNFTFEELEAAKNTVGKIMNFAERLKEVKGGKNNSAAKALIKKAKTSFEKAMDNNLDMPEALAAVFSFIRDINKLIDGKKLSKKDAELVLKQLYSFDEVLGLLSLKHKIDTSGLEMKVEALIKTIKPGCGIKQYSLDSIIKAAILMREEYRQKKDFKTADFIRAELLNIGIKIEDTEEGTKWKLVK